ncbi:MAG: homoserine dehydrogenase [Pirellulaceae bacterium]
MAIGPCHAGRTSGPERVVVRDPGKARDVDLPEGVMTTRLEDVLEDPSIEVVAQLIGGLEPARTIMLQLLEAGKDIVTANKALLAEYGPELFDRARELGRSIAFEASVAGGVPIINCISQSLSANQITSLEAILNGTSNFIVTAMEDIQADFETVVGEAQRLGLAEADPTLDVDGSDAAQKLAILAHLAFGARVHWSDIPRQGIDQLELADFNYANQLGYRIKLIAVARLIESGLELHVSPTLVRMFTPLAEVREANNAVSVVGDAVGKVFFHGLGAGQMPTASAVVADMIDTAVGRTRITFKTLQLWSDQEARVQPADPKATRSRFYMRLDVLDEPGVLAQVTGVLGKHQISIASVIQHGPAPDIQPGMTNWNVVPLIVMTHEAYEGAAADAIREIEQLDSVRSHCVRMRVLD